MEARTLLYVRTHSIPRTESPLTGRGTPMRRIRDYNPFDPLTTEDLERYAGKWVVAYRGRVRGVGESLEEALRRAGLPKHATPYIVEVPGDETWY